MKGLDDERERERELLSQPRQDDPAIQAALAEVRGLRNIVETVEQSDYMPKYLPPMYDDEGDAMTTTRAEAEIERLKDALDRIREHLNGGNVDAALNVIEDELSDEGERDEHEG